MPGESSLFEGEWWSPKWPMSSMPLPPDLRKRDFNTFRSLEDDLELGMKTPFEMSDVYDDEASLKSCPDRLWRFSRNMAH
jgi:hypothetical protein